MTTLTLSPVGRRALPRERPPHSTLAVAALGLAVLAAVAMPSRSRYRTSLTLARFTSP